MFSQFWFPVDFQTFLTEHWLVTWSAWRCRIEALISVFLLVNCSRYHPDKNGDDPVASDLFQEVTFSYNILSDPDKKRQYDTSGFEVIQTQIGVSRSFESFKHVMGTFCTMFRPLNPMARNWSWTYQVSIQ